MIYTKKIKILIEEPITGEWGEEGSGVKVIRTTNFTNDGRLDLSNVVERAISKNKVIRKRLQYGDIILEKSGGSPNQPVGRVVYFDIDGSETYLCNNFTTVIRPRKETDSRYLFWFLYYNHLTKNTLKFQNKTTGILNLQLDRYLETLHIPYPSVETQQKIAIILDKADELRRKDQLILGKYDELLQSVYNDMFVRKFNVVKEIKPKFLSEIADIVSGVAKNTKIVKNDFVEVPYMRVANVQDGHIDLQEVKTILVSQEDFNKYQLSKGDILLTEGGDPDKLGRGAVWNGEIAPCIHQNHIFRVRVREKDIHPTFLSYHLSSAYGKRYFLKSAKQTTGIASINLTQLRSFKAHIPDWKLQLKFVNSIIEIDQQYVIAEEQLSKSELLFQALLQKAFKGELI